MASPVRRVAAIAAAAALAVAFGAGFITAKVLPAHHAPGAQAALRLRLAPFGKPRDPRAPRAGARKPDGFAVWTTRVDTTAPDPLACVRMTRPLDPRKSYGDFVLVRPTSATPPAVSVA